MMALTLLAAVGGVHINKRKRLAILERLEQREQLSNCDLWKRYFSQFPQDEVEFVLGELAETLQVPPGVIRPTDRFDSDLAYSPGLGYDGRMESLSALFRQRLSKRGVTRVEYPETVGDYVMALLVNEPGLERSKSGSPRS